MTASQVGQTYRFGWCLAWSGLAGAVNPQMIEGLGSVLGTWGIVLGLVTGGWSLAAGVAAAAVRPWSWYVLLVSQLFALVWSGLYIVFVARDWKTMVMVAGFSLGASAISFVYFYKRRALFRARWRWEWLERTWPRLVGPEAIGPDVRPGFRGLSPARRRLFAGTVGIWILLELFSLA